jgi:hypothetical protein
MAAPRRQRLKVYRAQLGFFETVVAAPSQAAALRAWGVHQDLFAEGRAAVTTDPAATKAALADPGAPLRRPVGADAAFSRDPGGVPAVPEGARGARRRPAAKPDRTALAKAEARLEQLRAARADELRGLEARQAALDDDRKAAQAAFERAERDAKAALEAARRAYRKAGGAPERAP